MKSFTERVKRHQEYQGLHVFPITQNVIPLDRELVDLICMKNGIITLIRARGNGHGKLHEATKLRLQVLGKFCGVRVLHAKENGAGEVVFFSIYGR